MRAAIVAQFFAFLVGASCGFVVTWIYTVKVTQAVIGKLLDEGALTGRQINKDGA